MTTPARPRRNARLRVHQVRLARPGPQLSVLVPVYNEQATVEALLRRVAEVQIDKEILVVNDGSTDGTAEILDRIAPTIPGVSVIHHEKNRGKGAAVRTALSRARGRIILIQDADLEYDPADYPALIAPIVRGETKVVYGSRQLHQNNRYPVDRFKIGAQFLTWLANRLYRGRITDEASGYKVFRADLIKSIPLSCEGFEFCPEITAKVLRRGEKILEVPIRYYKRSVAEGKKIRAKDALIGAWTLIKFRFWG